nr:glycosyltransferase [Pedobacter heparinus]
MSLPYFKECGWEAEVVTVDPKYSDLQKDNLLTQSIPDGIKLHFVKAFNKKWTSKIGLGSLALRSIGSYMFKANQILKNQKFDLIYFSTTQFPVCILGAYWKKRFKIPYVIDMQDPWHSDYYQDKPKAQQPPKYWFSYRLNKYLEPIAIKNVDGLISVSSAYIKTLKTRYPQISNIPSTVITFGAFKKDFDIARDNQDFFKPLLQNDFINIVYVGRGGNDMHHAIKPLFQAVKNGMNDDPLRFKKIRLHFIGTSYAPAGEGKPTILPLARQYNIEDSVIEITDRISFYHTLLTLQNANALFVPGSNDPKYTASKIYPYLLTNKSIISILNKNSQAMAIMREYDVKHLYSYDDLDLSLKIDCFLNEVLDKQSPDIHYNLNAIDKYSAKNMTRHQCILFNKVVNE